MGLGKLTSAQLSDELRLAGLPVSGTKAEKLARLSEAGITSPVVVGPTTAESGEAILTAELASGGFASHFTSSRNVLGRDIPYFGLIVTFLLLTATIGAGVLAAPTILEWIGGEPEYELMDFDPAMARANAEHLVSLGHVDWQGRMSGTQEELATAQSNKDNFSSYGLAATLEEFEVPMFEIQGDPIIRSCIPGVYAPIPNLDPCGPGDLQASVTEYEHRIDYVIQGYSGTATYTYGDDLPIVNLSNGSDDSLWASASGAVGLVWSSAGVGSNTDLYSKAIQNDVAVLILVNVKNNCDKLEAGNCIPIFKTVDIDGLLEQTGGNLPETIPFVQVSKNMGEEMWQLYEDKASNDVRFSFEVRVANQGNLPVRVPCGILQGDDDKVIMFGAHHDTVYNGPGAIDDTSGTATVLEIARQFAILASEKGQPKHTLKFCTWGGEEEGLHGSRAWVDKHAESLRENLIVYINLDMNHVDIDPTRGDTLTLFGNYQSDVDHIENIVEKFKAERKDLANKYGINVQVLDGEKNSATGMPYNSDHGPFVYDIVHEEGDKPGHALVCYGAGSWEYHTYMDDMSRFNEESLAVSAIIYGTYASYLAYGE